MIRLKKTIKLNLKDVSPVPKSLRGRGGAADPAGEIAIDFQSLAHHLYIDTFDIEPPDPNPEADTYRRFVANTQDFRWFGKGLGSHKEVRIGLMNRFGKAFCRWVLHDHFDVVYFAHMDQVLGGNAISQAQGVRVERISSGDTPDYLCAIRSFGVCLAEAKGRAGTIGFDKPEFQAWRDQFSRVEVRNASGDQESVKGFIVATRMVSDDRPKTFSTMWIEDPRSPGEARGGEAIDPGLSELVGRRHYSAILSRLRLPLYSEALRQGAVVAEEVSPQMGVWEFLLPPLRGMLFVGGYIPARGFDPRAVWWDWPRSQYWSNVQLDLTARGSLFFGLQLDRYRGIRSLIVTEDEDFRSVEGSFPERARSRDDFLTELPRGTSLLKDWSLLCPLEYVRLVDLIN